MFCFVCCFVLCFGFVFCVSFVCLCFLFVFLVAVFPFLCGMVSQLHAPRTWKPVTALASLTVINTASTQLRNDLARAIKALEQKKKHGVTTWREPQRRGTEKNS